MRILTIVLGVVVALMVVLTVLRRNQSPLERIEPPPGEALVQPEELPKLWAVPDFSLTERSGKSVALADLKAKVWAANFIYTTCPGPCPIVTSGLGEVQKALAYATDFRLVSISTDPENDTPEVLKAYATRFHAGDRWFFLTGDKPRIYQLANQGFKLGVAEDRKAAEPIIHSTKVALVDRQGFVRGFFDGTDPESLQRLIKAIQKLLGEKL